MRITKENTSALFIDFQERLFPAMYGQDLLMKNTKILVEGMAVLSIPTVFTQQYTKGLGDTMDELRSLVTDFTYLEKTDFSCYGVEAYRKTLEDLKCKNIIVAGIEAHVCVLQTVVDLKHSGYNPIVVVDAIASRQPDSKAIAIERFRHEGIMMASAESILFELTGSAKDESFKAISKLVK